MADIKQRVGQKIKEARKAKGLTQEELGAKLGIDKPTVSKYENGKINPSLEVLSRIAQELELTLEVDFK